MDARDAGATEAELKNDIMTVLDALRARQDCYSFRLVAAQLKSAKMPTAVGWPPLLEKFHDMVASRERLIECRNEIRRIYLNSLVAGTRSVSIFEVSKGEAAIAAKGVAALIDGSSDFAKAFPLPVSNENLRKAGFNGVFCAILNYPDGSVRLIACCRRAFRTREEIDVANFEGDARVALEGFDEIIGVRSGFVQGFDSILIRPNLGVVEIQIDIACRLTRDDFAKARNFYADRLNALFGEKFNNDKWLLLPKNFFPLISKLYTSADGYVNSLGHATTTRSIKDERMRGRRSDLRKETFHDKGMAAILGATDEYSIRKGWDTADGERTPTVQISGHFSIAGGDDVRISYAIIDGCVDEEDFAMVMSKLK
ncbi:hypothetical protein [Burkholderia gladioli]|uniref:hypothetical protein n=1 Tax=Burkholderia gladioli TaxID=28095 RepID=UPI00163F8B6E|nr:hypothetical protein [Burkholderia gladioli]